MQPYPSDETLVARRDRNVREAHPELSDAACRRISAIVVTELDVSSVVDAIWDAQTKDFLNKIPEEEQHEPTN
jgi:hypothetical protein